MYNAPAMLAKFRSGRKLPHCKRSWYFIRHWMAWGSQRLDTEARLWVYKELPYRTLERLGEVGQMDWCQRRSSEPNRGSKRQSYGSGLGGQCTSLMGRQAEGEAKGLEDAFILV